MGMIAEKFDAFFIDLDGVVYVDNKPVSGAVEAITQLRDRNVTVRFITNSASKSRAKIAKKINSMGIDVPANEIISASWATASYLNNNNYEVVHLIGESGLRTEVDKQNIGIDSGDSEAVVVGSDYSFTYKKLKTATRLIHDNRLPFIATNIDPSFPTADGIAPGTGAIIAAIQTATGKEPIVIGKPEPTMFKLALDTVETERVAMIGDTLPTDIRGAQNADLFAILATGHQRAHANNYSDIRPDVVIEDLRGLFDPDIKITHP